MNRQLLAPACQESYENEAFAGSWDRAPKHQHDSMFYITLIESDTVAVFSDVGLCQELVCMEGALSVRCIYLRSPGHYPMAEYETALQFNGPVRARPGDRTVDLIGRDIDWRRRR